MKPKRIFFFAAFSVVFSLSAILFSYIASDNPWERFIGVSIGAFSFLICLSALYIKAGFGLDPNGLKILDWLLIGLDLTMMPCFQWVGAAPLYWLLIVLLPSLGVRAIISYYLKTYSRRQWAKLEKKEMMETE